MSTCAPTSAEHPLEAYSIMVIVSVRGVAFKTLVSVVLVVRSERFNFSSTKYGPTVSSGVNTQDAVVPEVVPEVDPLVELAEVLLPPQPLSAATPAPPRISIKRLRVSCRESRESLTGFRGFLVVRARLTSLHPWTSCLLARRNLPGSRLCTRYDRVAKTNGLRRHAPIRHVRAQASPGTIRRDTERLSHTRWRRYPQQRYPSAPAF